MHGRAHLVINSAIIMDAGLCLGLFCVAYASHEIRWKSRLRFESISWVALLTLIGGKVCSKSETSTGNSETDWPVSTNCSPLPLRRCQNGPDVETVP